MSTVANSNVAANFCHGSESLDFFRANYPELMLRFPKQFVAVVDGQFFGADSDYPALVKRLEGAGHSRPTVDTQYILMPDSPIR